MLTNELLTYLFDGQTHLLSPALESWLAASRRFTSFTSTFRDKIRKKLRVTQDPETLLDLRLELETAYLLLREPALSVVYEPQHSREGRSPDFAVTYTTSLTFMLEVTRLRLPQKTAVEQEQALDSLTDTIVSKLGQLLPQRGNVLILGVDVLDFSSSDLHAAMLRTQQRVERNDPTFWQRHRFRDRADFFRYYQRLSEVLVRGSQLQAEPPFVTWVNGQTKHPLPGRVRTALHHSHTIEE